MIFKCRALSRLVCALSAIALVSPSILHAEAPDNVSDLVGARAAGGESELESRNFTHIKAGEGKDRDSS